MAMREFLNVDGASVQVAITRRENLSASGKVKWLANVAVRVLINGSWFAEIRGSLKQFTASSTVALDLSNSNNSWPNSQFNGLEDIGIETASVLALATKMNVGDKSLVEITVRGGELNFSRVNQVAQQTMNLSETAQQLVENAEKAIEHAPAQKSKEEEQAQKIVRDQNQAALDKLS